MGVPLLLCGRALKTPTGLKRFGPVQTLVVPAGAAAPTTAEDPVVVIPAGSARPTRTTGAAAVEDVVIKAGATAGARDEVVVKPITVTSERSRESGGAESGHGQRSDGDLGQPASGYCQLVGEPALV